MKPWEVALYIAGALAVFCLGFGLVGYRLGNQPPQTIIVQFQQPLQVKLVP
jgi:hypothetical protein